MKRSILINVIAYLFILLFLYTGVEKFMEIKTFKDQLVASPLLGSVAGLLTWALPITEILLAIILFIPRWQLKGLYASLGLMIIFTIYLSTILLINSYAICSCGGIIEELSPRQHLLFNGAAIALAIIAIVSARRQGQTQQFRWIATMSALLLLGSIGWLIQAALKQPTRISTGLEGKLPPTFSLQLSDSLTWMNTANIPAGKPFIMIGFSPYCTHCQAELRDIIQHIKQFNDTSIYFVTSFGYEDMKKFYDAFHLNKYPGIVTGVDSSNAFLRYYKSNAIPYIAIYDAKKRLKAAMAGEVKAETLSKSLAD